VSAERHEDRPLTASSKALAALEAELRRVNAPVLAALRPGLGADSIRRLTQELPFRLPGEVAALYEWHDGSSGDGPAEELFPSGRFPSLQRAVEAYFFEVRLAREVTSGTGLDPDSSYAADWFPIFVTAGGDRYVATQAGSGPVRLLDRVDWSSQVEEAASFANFLEQLVERYQKGAYVAGPVRTVVVNESVLAQLRRGQRGDQAGPEALLAQLQGDDPDLQNHAVQEITRLRYPELVSPLIGLLTSPDSILRRRAALLLGAIGDRRAIPHLVRALAEWKGDDLASAWGGLQPIGGEGAIGHLEAVLRDGDSELRVLAAQALGNTEDATAVPALQAARHDADARVQAAADAALRRLGAT